jgi:hypothetical protein
VIFALGTRSFLPVPTHIDGSAPLIYYDGQDTNLKRNWGVTDGGTILTHKNKGSLGTTADATQATSGQRWIFRKIAASGKLKNLSALENDGARRMSTGTFTALTQPLLLFWVARTNGSGNNVIYGGLSWEAYTATLAPQFYAGSFGGGVGSITANTFHSYYQLGNGASGATKLDGSGSTVNLGTNSISQLIIGSDGGATFMTGFLETFLVYGGLTSNHPLSATLSAWVTAKIGATPQ